MVVDSDYQPLYQSLNQMVAPELCLTKPGLFKSQGWTGQMPSNIETAEAVVLLW